MRKRILILLLLISPCLSFNNDSKKNLFIEDQMPFLEPNGFFLKNYSKYVNPFDGILEMYFGLPDTCELEIKIKHDVNNTLVAYLKKDSFPSGYYKVRWNGKDLDNEFAEDGVYIFELKAISKIGSLNSNFVASSILFYLKP